MDAPAILTAVRNAYARLATYQDMGEVVSVSERASGAPHPKPHHMPFSTWLARPDKFRFDFAQRIGHPNFQKTTSVWMQNFVPKCHGWWTKGPTVADRERMDSFRNMVFYAGMSSHNAASRVPRLLMPDRLPEEQELTATAARAESLGSLRCHAIEVGWANTNGSFKEEWWVGAEDLLIRKVVCVMKFCAETSQPLREKIKADTVKRHADGKMSDEELRAALESFNPENALLSSELTTTYTPTVGAAIPDNVFDFRPDP